MPKPSGTGPRTVVTQGYKRSDISRHSGDLVQHLIYLRGRHAEGQGYFWDLVRQLGSVDVQARRKGEF